MCFSRVVMILLLVGFAVVIAQTSRGTVTGTVLDPSGVAIPAARATLTAVETGTATPNETSTIPLLSET